MSDVIRSTDAMGLSAFEKVVESSPVIVVVLMLCLWLTWSTWRTERREMIESARRERDEMLAELREEREARANQNKEILAMGERQTLAVNAVERAVTELRHAIKETR